MANLDEILRIVQVLEPIVVPLVTALSDRDVKHDIKPIS